METKKEQTGKKPEQRKLPKGVRTITDHFDDGLTMVGVYLGNIKITDARSFKDPVKKIKAEAIETFWERYDKGELESLFKEEPNPFKVGQKIKPTDDSPLKNAHGDDDFEVKKLLGNDRILVIRNGHHEFPSMTCYFK